MAGAASSLNERLRRELVEANESLTRLRRAQDSIEQTLVSDSLQHGKHHSLLKEAERTEHQLKVEELMGEKRDDVEALKKTRDRLRETELRLQREHTDVEKQAREIRKESEKKIDHLGEELKIAFKKHATDEAELKRLKEELESAGVECRHYEYEHQVLHAPPWRACYCSW